VARVAAQIVLANEERAQLESWALEGPRQRATRVRIILLAARGFDNGQIVERLRRTRYLTTKNTVTTWRRRFFAQRLNAFAL
jgi:hypothetical protein